MVRGQKELGHIYCGELKAYFDSGRSKKHDGIPEQLLFSRNGIVCSCAQAIGQQCGNKRDSGDSEEHSKIYIITSPKHG